MERFKFSRIYAILIIKTMKATILGIDPGVSAGCICALENGVLYFHKMPESLKDIRSILMKYGGHPSDTKVRCAIEKLSSRPLQNPIKAKRMEPMLRNYDRIKDALIDCNIQFREVAPRKWQSFRPLGLIVSGEKGIDYDEFKALKKELKEIDKLYPYLNKKAKSDLKISLEKDIETIKRKETQIRKKRYQKKAIFFTGDPKLPLWKADALLILMYQKYNM